MTPKVIFKDLKQINYKKAWDYQTKIFQKTVNQKLINRKLEINHQAPTEKTQNHLLFCEHNPVFTLGKSGDEKNLLISEELLKHFNIEYYKINRGGDITFHGPGQIVGYPIFDLDYFFTDIHKYLRYIEEAIIVTLAEYNIIGSRIDGLTGVWLDVNDNLKARKIAAIGVKASRWVTMHGFALNVNTDLDYFNKIIPCGISDKQVTSMQKELGFKVNFEEVKQKLLLNLASIFDFETIFE